MIPALRAENVIKTFGSLRAVDGVSLNLKPGEAVALLGPNGAGKTTLVEMVEGIQKPDSGTIEILGLNWKNHAKELRKRIGLVLQENKFLDRVTVLETLKLFASFYNSPVEQVETVLDKIRLREKKDAYTMNLSGGQRQRLAIGLGLLNDPELLLLDEPTTGLDPNARRDIWKIIEDLKEKGCAILLTTHYMEEAEALCDRINVMYRGKVIASGTMKSLLNSRDYQSIIDLQMKPRHSFRFENENIVRAEALDGGWRLYARNLKDTLPPLMAWIKENDIEIEDLNCRNLNLDDIFTELTGERLANETN